jgi:hypothetical protein
MEKDFLEEKECFCGRFGRFLLRREGFLWGKVGFRSFWRLKREKV